MYGDDRRLAELELVELRNDFAHLCAFLPEDESMKLREIVHGLTQLRHDIHDPPFFPTWWPSGLDLLMFSKNHPAAFLRIRDKRFLATLLFRPIGRADKFLEELWAMMSVVVDALEAEAAKEVSSEAAKPSLS